MPRSPCSRATPKTRSAGTRCSARCRYGSSRDPRWCRTLAIRARVTIDCTGDGDVRTRPIASCGVMPRDVPVREVQRELLRQGASLRPELVRERQVAA